ncbi:hypothetical protein STEG23_034361 [Scotinomys teguina]
MARKAGQLEEEEVARESLQEKKKPACYEKMYSYRLTSICNKMPKLLQGIVTVIDVFYQYATEHRECDMLSKKEMKRLLENEFHQILRNPDDPDTVDIIMQSLDRDHNKKVDFTEYLLMIIKLAQACNKIIGKDYCQASGSKQGNHSHQHQEEQSEEENDDNEQDSKSSYSSSSAGENDAYFRGSRGSNKHKPTWNYRKPRTGKEQNSEKRTKSNSRNLEKSEKHKQGQNESGSTHTSNKSRRRFSTGEASSYPQNGCKSEQYAGSRTQESSQDQSYGKGKHNISSGKSSVWNSGEASNYDTHNSASHQSSSQKRNDYGSEQSSGSGECGTESRNSSGSTEQGYGQGEYNHSGTLFWILQQQSGQRQFSGSEEYGASSGRAQAGLSKDMALVQHSLMVQVNMALQWDTLLDPHGNNQDNVSSLALKNMVLPQDIHQAGAQGKDMEKVSSLALDHMELHQDIHQAVALVSQILVASKDQGQDFQPVTGEAGLVQRSLMAPSNMGLAQEDLLAVVNMDLDKVTLPIVGNKVLSLESHQSVAGKDLVIVSLPALAHTTQPQATLLTRGDKALGQHSLMVQVNTALQWDTLLDPHSNNQDNISSLALKNMVLPQDIHQAGAQVSPFPTAHKAQDQASKDMALVQHSLMVQVNMDLHWDTLLAPQGKDVDKVSSLALDHMALHQDIHQAVALVSQLLVASKDQGQVFQPVTGEAGLVQRSLMAPSNMGLVQEDLLAVVNMDLANVSLPTEGNKVLSLESHQAVSSKGLVIISLLAVAHTFQGQAPILLREDMALFQDSLVVHMIMVLYQDTLAVQQGKDVDKVNILDLHNMVLHQVSP